MAFLGMRGTGSWSENELPGDWLETLLYLEPNGDTPLLGILSKLNRIRCKSFITHWYTELASEQRVEIEGLYNNPALDDPYVQGSFSAGGIVYAKVADTVADNYLRLNEFRKGLQVLARNPDNPISDVNLKVIDLYIVDNATSYLKLLLLEDDEGVSNKQDLIAATYIIVIGDVNPEGSDMPEARSSEPDLWYNYTQINRTPYSLTRTLQQSGEGMSSRIGDMYARMRREALLNHGRKMEFQLMFGVRSSAIGSNGQPERTSMGIIQAIKGWYSTELQKYSGLIDDYASNPDYAGMSWTQGGEEFLKQAMLRVFEYGSRNKIAFCGNRALLAIDALVKDKSTYNISAEEKSYGIMVKRLVCPFGEILIKEHPLLTQMPGSEKIFLILDPKNIKMRELQPTYVRTVGSPLGEKGHTARDATTEEFLSEQTYTYHSPRDWGLLTNLGVDNS